MSEQLGKAVQELYTQMESSVESRMDLYAQLTAAQQRVAGYVEQIKLLQAEVDELRAIKFKRFSNEECWIYQGDGEDHLESLVCPVVVSPHKMMELEANKRIADSFVRLDEKASGKLQQRVAELEQFLQQTTGDAFKYARIADDIAAANARLRELLRECVYELMPDAYELRDKIEAELAKGE